MKPGGTWQLPQRKRTTKPAEDDPNNLPGLIR
jgi:hypothetical protein